MKNIDKNNKGTRGGFSFPISDEATPVTTGIKYTDTLIYGLELEEVYAVCNVAPTTTDIIIDMLKNGISMLTNKIIIPIGTTTSRNTTTPAAINDSTILDTDIIAFEIIQGDVAGAGVKVHGKGWELNN
jgi:hypothetical protein